MNEIQGIREQADKQDRRRQRQIKQQAARLDSMKELVHELAGEVQKYEEAANEYEPREVRSIDRIIEDAIKRA